MGRLTSLIILLEEGSPGRESLGAQNLSLPASVTPPPHILLELRPGKWTWPSGLGSMTMRAMCLPGTWSRSEVGTLDSMSSETPSPFKKALDCYLLAEAFLTLLRVTLPSLSSSAVYTHY